MEYELNQQVTFNWQGTRITGVIVTIDEVEFQIADQLQIPYLVQTEDGSRYWIGTHEKAGSMIAVESEA
jgi:hypothetical protein